MIRKWFQRKNEILFSCKKTHLVAYNNFKPNYSGTFMPEWFKKLSKTYEVKNEFNLKLNVPTVSTCYGIKNTITNGIILPLWTDIVIEVYPDKSWVAQPADNLTVITQHPQNQHIGLLEKCCVLKISSPWMMQSKQTTSFFAIQPLYHQGDVNNFFILPGFLTFNNKPSSTNMFIAIPFKNEVQRVIISCGFPIIQYINTTKEVINIKTKLIDDETFRSYQITPFFLNSFDKLLKIGRRNENSN